MKKMYLLAAIAFWLPSFAATSVHQPKTATPAIAASAPSVSQSELELKVREEQIATMREYHSSLIDTVYWALGTVATVAALLVGFGWFTNFKFHESEKQRLKDELDGKIKEALSAFEAKISSNEVQVLNSVDSRLDGYFTRVSRDIDIARSEAVGMHERNSNEMEKIKAQLIPLEQAKDRSEVADHNMEAKLREVEAYVWEIKKIPTNQLITQAQGLRAAVKANNVHYVKLNLRDMEETITKSLLPSDKEMSKDMLTMVRDTVANASKIDLIAAARVNELLDKIQIEPDERP